MSQELRELHTSERSAFHRCPQRWVWQYEMGLQARGEHPDALWFGIGIHYALATWYKKGKRRGPHPADTWLDWAGDSERYIRAQMSERNSEWYDEPLYLEARELGETMLVEYIDKYGRDEDWDVIFVEHPFKVRILDKYDKPVALFASTFDGVFRDMSDGLIYLMEHKTAGQISIAHLPSDDQAGAYWAVASDVLRARNVLKPGEEISGICYNFLRKSMPDPRPENEAGQKLNQDGRVSKKQPAAPFLREYVERSPKEHRAQLLRIADEVTVMQAIRDGVIPTLKSRTKDCPYCPFYNMCMLHDRGGNSWEKLAKAEFITGDPYERDAKSASS